MVEPNVSAGGLLRITWGSGLPMLPQPCLRLQCDLILFLTMTHTCYRSCRGHGSSRAKSAAKSQSWVGADREQEKRAYGVPAACQPQLSRWMSRVRHPRHPVWRHRVLPLQRWRRRSHCRKKWVGGAGVGPGKPHCLRPRTQSLCGGSHGILFSP